MVQAVIQQSIGREMRDLGPEASTPIKHRTQPSCKKEEGGR